MILGLNAEDRADLVNALKVGFFFFRFKFFHLRLFCLVLIFCCFLGQNKLQDLTGKHSDVLETLSPLVRKRVEVLREIQVWTSFGTEI